MNDEELHTARRALETYNAQLEGLSRQMNILRATRDETMRASRALRAIADAKVGEEVLVPVGASAYIRVQVTGKDTLRSIGNGVSVDVPASEAADKMDADRAEVEKAIEDTVNTVKEIQGYIRELSDAIQQEYTVRQAQGRNMQ